MRFEIRRTSYWKYLYYKTSEEEIIKKMNIPNTFKVTVEYEGIDTKIFIEIKDLEELLKLQKAVKNEIIIDKQTIEIYDDWRE